jgi:gluconolactonase
LDVIQIIWAISSSFRTDFAAGATLATGQIFGTKPVGKGDGVPDGMKLDLRGNIFVTGPQGIWLWDPHGHYLGAIVLPE